MDEDFDSLLSDFNETAAGLVGSGGGGGGGEEADGGAAELRAIVEEQEATIAQLDRQITEQDADLTVLNDSVVQLENDLEEQIQAGDELLAENESLKAKLATLESDNSGVTLEKVQTLEAQVDEAQAQSKKYMLEVAELAAEVDTLRAAADTPPPPVAPVSSEGKGSADEALLLQVNDQTQIIETLNTKVRGLVNEKRELLAKITKLMTGDSQAVQAAGAEKVHELEAKLKTAQEQVRKLVGAIKSDRQGKQQQMNEIAQERDEETARAETMERKLVSLIDMMKAERENHKAELAKGGGAPVDAKALEAARSAVASAEKQISAANNSANEAQRLLTSKEEELTRIKLLARRKANEAKSSDEENRVLNEKLQRILEATRMMKLENARLRVNAGGGGGGGGGGEDIGAELVQATERSYKLEAAARKLRAILTQRQDEYEEKEKLMLERLKRAEDRASGAELRARNAVANVISVGPPGPPGAPGAGPPPPPGAGGPPPPAPPPPPPPMKTYQFKINRTGQSGAINGEKGKANGQAMVIGSIVDAIKNGVKLRKTAGPGQATPTNRSTVDMSEDEIDDFSILTKLSNEIAVKKNIRMRDIKKKQRRSYKNHKKGRGELDNLLSQLEDLDDL